MHVGEFHQHALGKHRKSAEGAGDLYPRRLAHLVFDAANDHLVRAEGQIVDLPFPFCLSGLAREARRAEAQRDKHQDDLAKCFHRYS